MIFLTVYLKSTKKFLTLRSMISVFWDSILLPSGKRSILGSGNTFIVPQVWLTASMMNPIGSSTLVVIESKRSMSGDTQVMFVLLVTLQD